MQRNRMTWMAAVLGTAALTSLVGCGKGMQAGDKGSAKLNASVKLSVADINNVMVHVQGALESVDITVPMMSQASNTQYSAIVSDLPIGCDYIFTASAKDGTSTEIYHGAVSGQCITKNQTASVVIDMNQVATPVSLFNEAPKIDGITETASCVSKNDTVVLKATANDTDAGDTAGMTWAWTVDSTCGTISAPVNTAGTDTIPGTSTVTFTATAASANCQVNFTVHDARMPTVLMTTGSITVQIGDACAFGNAKITAIPNTCPVMSSVGASTIPVAGTPSFVPMVPGQSTFVSVAATDADGDTLLYSWSSPDCAGGTPATTFGVWNDSTAKAGTWFLLNSAPPAGAGCTFIVHVSDGTFADGKPKCDIVNHLSLPVKGSNDATKSNPVFGFDYQSEDLIGSGDQVNLEIVAPTCGTGTPTLVWAPALPALTPLTAPFTTGVVYTAPSGAEGLDTVTVTVTATCPDTGLASTHTFTMHGKSAVCALPGVVDGTDCTSTASGSNKCILSAKCVAGACVAQTSKSCPASTTACQDNVCAPATGNCGLVAQSDGTACTDGLACTTGDKCAAGLCGGTAVVCAATGDPCRTNACTEPSGTCVSTSAADGTVCSDANGCTGIVTAATGSDPGVSSTTSDHCTAGVCVAGPAVTCSVPNDVCTSVTASTFSCGAPQCDVFSWAKMVVPPLNGLAINPAGTPWITGSLFTPYDFGSGTVSSSGGADMYLVKIDPATGLAAPSSAFLFGDTGAKNQNGSGVAVASSGNVGVIGTFTGEIDFTGSNSDGSGPSGNPGTAGLDFLQNASQIPFYAVMDGTSSGTFVTPKFAHMVDVGTGALLSIASNPTQNAIAICGKTSKAVPNNSTSGATKGVITGGAATFGGGSFDLVVFKVDGTTGNVIWGKQFGGAGDQVCESVAIDNSGNVMIAGNYSGSLFSLPAVADVSGNTAVLFMAKLNSADGTLASAVSWGGTGASHAPALTVDGSGNIIMGGGLATSIDFGTGVLAYTGGGNNDAFVVKFNSSMATQWAKLDGDSAFDQNVKALATDSSGNVIVVGSYKGTLPLFGLTASGNAATDAFQVQLSASGSVIACSHSYGDATGAQAMTMVSVARAASGSLLNAIFVGGALSGQMQLKTTPLILLDTGSAGTAFSFFGRASE